MPYSGDVRQEERLKKLEVAAYGTQLLHVKTTFEVYERDEETGEAVLVRTMDDLDLLIDPSTSDRKLRSEATDLDAWDELAGEAKLIHIPITCHQKQLDIITDAHSSVVGVISGSRAGKTHSIAFRLLRRWMLRGGDGHEFFWLSPSWKQTEIGVAKLCKGDEQVSPVFPADLVVSFPKDQYQTKQYIELIDGSQVHLFQCGAKGGNIKGYGPYDIFVDELAEIRHRENWTVALNRLTTKRGTIAAASTPVAGHWSRSDIVTRATYSDEVSHYSISIFDNPWEHPATIEKLIESLGGHKDPVVRREFYGDWIANSAALWPDWTPEKHLVQDHDVWDIVQLTAGEHGFLPAHYVDVTARAVSEVWRGHHGARFVGGQDFNVYPCSTVIAKVFGDPRDRSTWGLFVVDEVLTRGSIQNHCDVLAQKYPGLAIACDSTGALRGTHASQGATGNQTNVTEMRRLGFDAKACHAIRGKVSNPRQIDSLNLCYRLQRRDRSIVHTRAIKLCESFDLQERDFDGRIKKQSATESDRISGPSDAYRYLVWALFKDELKNRVDNG